MVKPRTVYFSSSQNCMNYSTYARLPEQDGWHLIPSLAADSVEGQAIWENLWPGCWSGRPHWPRNGWCSSWFPPMHFSCLVPAKTVLCSYNAAHSSVLLLLWLPLFKFSMGDCFKNSSFLIFQAFLSKVYIFFACVSLL